MCHWPAKIMVDRQTIGPALWMKLYEKQCAKEYFPFHDWNLLHLRRGPDD
jgi:hypothetical protein